jgi:lysophospholipase L1-like esterase
LGLYSYPRNIWPLDHLRSLKQNHLGINSQKPNNPNYIEIVEQYKLFQGKSDIVMVGDSITHHGNWSEIFPNNKIKNRGIGGDSTYHILKRIDSIISLEPKAVFLMVGVNDFGMNRSINEVFTDYIQIINILRTNKIKVFVQSTIECRESLCGVRLTKIRQLNNMLKNYASANNITYINLNDEITNKKEGLLGIYTYDGIHLRGNAYVIWAKKITPFIN